MMPPSLDSGHAARRRRAGGLTTDFDGQRLALARRLACQSRAAVARSVGVSPAAITQYEKGDARPTAPILASLGLTLQVPRDFFRTGRPVASIPSSSAHFRSLRSTSAAARDQALAFAELSTEVVDLLEQYIDFPTASLPELELPTTLTRTDIEAAARLARQHFGLPAGPVPHVVRLLEAHGVLVLRLPPEMIDEKVDAFSTNEARRPTVLLSPLKDDRARSRFDAAHELGHLLLHHDVEPGSRIIEKEADTFAAEFLMPAAEVVGTLPHRLDWAALHAAKRHWGTSLRSLVYRGHDLGVLSDAAYRRGNQQLTAWAYPEPGPLGPPEMPSLLGNAATLLAGQGYDLAELASAGNITLAHAERVVAAATDSRPRVQL